MTKTCVCAVHRYIRFDANGPAIFRARRHRVRVFRRNDDCGFVHYYDLLLSSRDR